MALPIKKVVAPPVSDGVNFLSMDFYTGGFTLPEGDYVWTKVDVVMHAGFGPNADQTKQRLGAMIHLKDLRDLAAEVRPIFCSFGTSAHLSFAPNPATGKGVVPIPGGKASTLPSSTNWAILLKSIYDSDPTLASVASNDVSIFEGMWAHMKSVPEPDERKGFAQAAVTGEAAVPGQTQERKAQMTPVVTDILDAGKPWEGTGGVPAVSPFADAKTTAAKVNGAVKPATTVPKAAPAPVAVAEATAEVDDGDIRTAAINALADVLGSKPEGGSKLMIRTSTFAYLKKAHGDDVGSAVIDAYFQPGKEDALNTVLGEHGYVLAGGQIKPAA